MKWHFTIVAAAALAIGGFSVARAEDKPAGDSKGVGQTVREEAAKVGIGSADKASEKMTPHAEQIHDVLAQVAEAAVTKSGLDDIVERFAKADRERLEKDKDALKADDTLKGRIAELQKDWKAKYNQDFDIKDEDKVFNQAFAGIMEANIGSQARTASDTAAGAAAADSTVAPPADTNAAKDNRNTAIVHINAGQGLPALDVPMVEEGLSSWKIDIPDTVDAAKVKQNVLTALTDIGEKKDQWPAEADDGYRLVTHRLLLAIFDKPATEGASQ